MNRFLATILLFFSVPLLLLVLIYLVTDPYKTLRSFSLEYFDDTNRDYLSSELWLMNYPEQKYDSYIFGSSRACGINTYHWLKYLPENSKQFLFQGWGESITGIEQKISFIDSKGLPVKNVILLIDYPGTFGDDQVPTEALSIKHPAFSQQSKIIHETILFTDFVQKPSQWSRAVKRWRKGEKSFVIFDPISNDWDKGNKDRDLSVPPDKDSLKNCSELVRNVFLKENAGKIDADLPTCEPVINKGFENQLQHIMNILAHQGTDYRVIITPGYCYTSPKVNVKDLEILNRVFGADKVFDFSGKNYMTEDYNNYSDPGHFGMWVGWHLIEDVYNKKSESNSCD